MMPSAAEVARPRASDEIPRWRKISESILTLFIIGIFSMSAGQVIMLVKSETKAVSENLEVAMAGRSVRMIINRSAADLESALMVYHLTQQPGGYESIENQQSYFLSMLDHLEPSVSPDDKKSLIERRARLVSSTNKFTAYKQFARPLPMDKTVEIIEDLSVFRSDVSEFLTLLRTSQERYKKIEIDNSHEFLLWSISSMGISGLGLIVLLLMKLRMLDRLLIDRQKLSLLLEPRMAAIETAMDGVAITDSNGRMRYVNEALTRYHGYAAPEMLTHLHWKVLYDEEQQKWFDAEVLPHLKDEGSWRGHCKGLRLDGTYFHQDVAIVAQEDGGLVFVVRDYTDLLESIDLSNRRLVAIEAAGDGIGIVDGKGRLTYVNRALRELHGINDDELDDYVGHPWTELYTPRGQEEIKGTVLPLLYKTGHWQGEAPIMRKNGALISAELSLTLLPDGGFIGTARDVSERKKAEQEKEDLQKQFYQAQKMEAIGRMAGGIAHDFNNILSSILGYAEFLMEDLDRETPQSGFARQIYSGGTQARKLVDQILAFSRRREGGMTAISLTDSVRETADMLHPVKPSNVKLVIEGGGVDNVIHANPTQISQALMNLCVNAIDALDDKEGAILNVTTKMITAHDGTMPAEILVDILPKAETEPRVSINQDRDGTCVLQSGVLLRGADYACVSVRDNGCGMDRMVMEHIFEPFFTTKPIDHGTGLGLSAVHGIVAAHRGAMTVESLIGHGTTFTLYFPLGEGKPEQGVSMASKVISGHGRVLVVDDQPDVAAIAGEMLTRLGYVVDLAASGYAAIDLLRERPGEYDLVLADYSMPVMSGVELAQEVHSDFPSLPVIVMTGYGRKKLEREMKDNAAVSALIRKPLDRVVLSQVVSRVLHKAAAA